MKNKLDDMPGTSEFDAIASIVVEHYPLAQAIYLFGSYGTAGEWPESDVDIAVLLPPGESRRAVSMAVGKEHGAIERVLGRDVDLINLRRVSTVLQKEIVMGGRRIYCADLYAAEEFEMHTLSLYQKLSEERAEILAEGLRSGRFYNV